MLMIQRLIQKVIKTLIDKENDQQLQLLLPLNTSINMRYILQYEPSFKQMQQFSDEYEVLSCTSLSDEDTVSMTSFSSNHFPPQRAWQQLLIRSCSSGGSFIKVMQCSKRLICGESQCFKTGGTTFHDTQSILQKYTHCLKTV